MAETETETPTHKKSAKGLTGYILLEYSSGADGWNGWLTINGPTHARSAEEAIRKHGEEGTFVAIPARSWKPVTVEAKQTVTLDLKPAT